LSTKQSNTRPSRRSRELPINWSSQSSRIERSWWYFWYWPNWEDYQ
jgi:hypothetical protein